MIELKPCTKTDHENCPHLSIRKCCDVSRMHFCMKWRMNRAKDGIIHACEEPKEESSKESMMICQNAHKCTFPQSFCIHRTPHKKMNECDYSGIRCLKCIPYVEETKPTPHGGYERVIVRCQTLEGEGLESVLVRGDPISVRINSYMEHNADIHTQRDCNARAIELYDQLVLGKTNGLDRLTAENQELTQKIARLEDLLSRSIKNNGLDKQARINVLAEEVRKKDRQIAAQKMTIDAQAAAIKEWVEDEKERHQTAPSVTVRTCTNCKHNDDLGFDCIPCNTGLHSKWEPK